MTILKRRTIVEQLWSNEVGQQKRERRPAGPSGGCCCCCGPSSPKISLKSSSSVPAQFAVVIGLDRPGCTPPLDRRRPLEQFVLSENVTFTDCPGGELWLGPLSQGHPAVNERLSPRRWTDPARLVAPSPSLVTRQPNSVYNFKQKSAAPLRLSFPQRRYFPASPDAV